MQQCPCIDRTGQPDLQLVNISGSAIIIMSDIRRFHLHCATMSELGKGGLSYNSCQIATWDSSPSDSGQGHSGHGNKVA